MGSTANGPSPSLRWTRGVGGDGAPEREHARRDPSSGDRVPLTLTLPRSSGLGLE